MLDTVTKKIKRRQKFKRFPDEASNRQITKLSLSIIDTIERYRIISSPLLYQLIDTHPKVTARHLRQLYDKGLVNRFCFMKGRTPGEFHYYLDDARALNLLVEEGVKAEQLDFDEVKRNREKRYCDINDPGKSEEREGTRLFLKHETMISRFHGMVELGCKQTEGMVELSFWQQGPGLWNSIEVPKVGSRLETRAGRQERVWYMDDGTEKLPHRPDALFTLALHRDEAEPEQVSFFYEADRKTTNTTRLIKKLRAHFHYIVVEKKHQEHYNVPRIRAVLVETLDENWAEHLRQQVGAHPVVSKKPSPLFWFTHSGAFASPVEIEEGISVKRKRVVPFFLQNPKVIFERQWRCAVNDNTYSLLD
jgi:hypothetical protein